VTESSQTIQDRIERDELLIIDGAMGTELERRGIPMDDQAWSGATVWTHPDEVLQLHQDYVAAGADIIITDTFSTARHSLEAAGLGAYVREINRNAADLAREAAKSASGRKVYVAGSISTFSPRLDPATLPAEATARRNYREQAELLAEAGVDFLIIEMIRETAQTILAVEEMVATGLPVWAGFSTRRSTSTGELGLWVETDTPLDEAVRSIMGKGASVAAVMHTDVASASEALSIVRANWSGPLVTYPHSGSFAMPHYNYDRVVTPDEFVDKAKGWAAQGVKAIGGCCGIGPEHIRRLRQAL
jgi:methionine synthase I (cobalamin-dependent)